MNIYLQCLYFRITKNRKTKQVQFYVFSFMTLVAKQESCIINNQIRTCLVVKSESFRHIEVFGDV